MKFILDGLPSSIKKKVEECNSARYLWLKPEKEYQNKQQDIEKSAEEKPIEDMKKETLQDPDKNPPKSTWRIDEEKLLTNEIEVANILQELEYSSGSTYIEIRKYDFFDFKEKMLETLEKWKP